MKQISLNIFFCITFLLFIGCSINQSKNEQTENTPIDKETQVSKEDFEINSLKFIENWENQMMNIYNKSLPSVVQINTKVMGSIGGYGTGFIWDDKGHIITNYHVIRNSNEITLTFSDLYEYDAELVGYDIDSDVAVLKLLDSKTDIAPITIGNSNFIFPGQLTLAIGNPFGEAFTMTTGIISATGRAIDSGFTNFQIPDVIQTDAAINPGNSGGPLLNIKGEVIGINTQIKSETRQNSGVGFAVPINLVKKVVKSLIEKKSHKYAYLGISAIDVNKFIREINNIPNTIQGALIINVQNNGPAEKYGLLGDTGNNLSPLYDGDIITGIDETKIRSMNELVRYLALNKNPGDKSILRIFRDGKEEKKEIIFGFRPE
ncbi:MAG: trypsin [Chloroflexi bacterium]|nr:trypsin [Chloroflexota bacterium]|tara:strand:- start:82244 stop:83368 length:1125 start_codon:yes stop_codon:yes gene_type:complete